MKKRRKENSRHYPKHQMEKEEERNKYVDHKTHLFGLAKAGSNYIFYSIGWIHRYTLCLQFQNERKKIQFHTFFFLFLFIQDVHTIHRKTIFQTKQIFDKTVFFFHLRSLENRIHSSDEQWTNYKQTHSLFTMHNSQYCKVHRRTNSMGR